MSQVWQPNADRCGLITVVAVAIALPDFDTYRSLAERTARSLAAAAVSIWFVYSGGDVTAS